MSKLHDEIWARYRDPNRFMHWVDIMLREHKIPRAELARVAGIMPYNVVRYFDSASPSCRRKPSMKTMVLLDEALEEILRGREPK